MKDLLKLVGKYVRVENVVDGKVVGGAGLVERVVLDFDYGYAVEVTKKSKITVLKREPVE